MALPGFAKYFRRAAEEEKEHAEKFMKFQVQRGGRIILNDIKKPTKDEWGTGLEAMQAALELEKSINQALLDLHKIANDNGDFQVATSSPISSHNRLSVSYGCRWPTLLSVTTCTNKLKTSRSLEITLLASSVLVQVMESTTLIVKLLVANPKLSLYQWKQPLIVTVNEIYATLYCIIVIL